MRKILFIIIIALLSVTGAWALEATHTVNNLIYKVVQPATGEKYAILSGYENYPEGILDIPISVTLGKIRVTVTMIGEQAFIDCEKITQVNIPSSIKSIGDRAFEGCISLTSFNVNSKNTDFCSENGILFNKAKTTLLQYPPAKADTGYSIPDGVTKIGDGAFYDCSKLTVMTIPGSVATIGKDALILCTGLTELFVHATTPPSVGTNAFMNVNLAIPVYVPAASLDAYKAANVWKEFTNLQAPVTEFTVDNLKYNVTDNTADKVELTGYVTKPTGKLDIPATVTYGSKTYSVTSIVERAFSGCSALTEVTIPASVTSVGISVFYGCSSLTQATIGDGLTVISQTMFANCTALEKLVIGKGVTEINNYAFSSCFNLKEITVLASNPPSVSSDKVFYYVSRDIPVYVPSEALAAYKAAAGWKDFTNLQPITEFTVGNLKYKVADHIDEVELTGYVTEPTGKLDIPATVTYGSKTYSVTSIGDDAFSGCSALTEVTIPASVTSVGNSVFYGCSSLTQATIGDGLTVISLSMFTNCYALEKLVIGKGVTEIGTIAFGNCSKLKEITVLASNPPSVASDKVFQNVSRDIPVYVPSEALAAYKAANVWKGFTNLQPITEFTVGNLKYKVADHIDEVELTGYATEPTGKLYIPASVTYGSKTYLVTGIKNDAFYGCSEITEVTIPTYVKSIGLRAFYECTSLTKVTIPESVTSLGQVVFANCSSLTQATIGNGVTEIRFGLFGDCTALEKVVIGKGVTKIGNVAFKNCSKIKEMTVQATVPPTVEDAQSLGSISRDIPVYVPAESLDAYKAANVWKGFTNLQPISGTGIDATTMQESITITDGMLHNPQRLPVCIYDLTGRQVYSGNETTIELPAGIYVVSCNGTSRKVMF